MIDYKHILFRFISTLLSQSASGTGLVFIVFTEALIEMPGTQVWAVLLFVMLFSLGLSSIFASIDAFLAVLCDLNLVSKWIPNDLVTGGQWNTCLLMFFNRIDFYPETN